MNIKVFTVPNCRACETVKELLRQEGLAFQELDVSANFANLRQLRRLTSGRRVPVTAVGDNVVVGDDAEALRALLRHKEVFEDESGF